MPRTNIQQKGPRARPLKISIDRRSSLPVYELIAAAIRKQIQIGSLSLGDRLPNQRELSIALDVAIGTVTRAYRLLLDEGLIVAQSGRGTYVQDTPRTAAARSGGMAPSPRPELSDLRGHATPSKRLGTELSRHLRLIADEQRFDEIMSYDLGRNTKAHKPLAADWIARTSGFDAHPDDIVITSGAQHALMCCLINVTQPGDIILVEEYGYSVLKALASTLRIKLVGIPMDRDGIIPEQLEAAVREHDPRALFCVPTIQNPTAVTMPVDRRQAIAAIAKRRQLLVLESDIFGGLVEDKLPTIKSMIPNLTVLITGFSKTLAPGMRIGYLVAPEHWKDRFSAVVHATNGMPSPIALNVISSMIRTGGADQVLASNISEYRARCNLVRNHLAGFSAEIPDVSPHIWLQLPPGHRVEDFIAQLYMEEVLVLSGSNFATRAVGEVNFIRIVLGRGTETDMLENALIKIRRLLSMGPTVSRFTTERYTAT